MLWGDREKSGADVFLLCECLLREVDIFPFPLLYTVTYSQPADRAKMVLPNVTATFQRTFLPSKSKIIIIRREICAHAPGLLIQRDPWTF